MGSRVRLRESNFIVDFDFIADFEMDKLKDLPALKEIDLSNNNFNQELIGRLQTINHLSMKL